ncbi:MAG: hypothetical protein OXF41_11040 [bacterium]|nr:hypothetical protein [bacterium]
MNQPRPEHAPEDRSDSREPERAHPRWATTSWWRVVVVAEVTVLAVLGYMASGERFPFYPDPQPSLADLTHSEIVGCVILAVVGVGLLGLPGRWWWKPGLAAALAVALGVVVIAFGWGIEDQRLYVLDHPGPDLEFVQDAHACRERAPTTAQKAFSVGRVPDECRDIWLNAATTTTTTTLPPIQTKRADLLHDLDTEDRAALEALGDAYEILGRSLDDNEQTAILAYVAARNSGNQDLEDTAQEVMAGTLDDLDRTGIQLVFDAYGRLREQLYSKQSNIDVRDGTIRSADPWIAINGYLSVAQPDSSDFDSVLDAMGFDLNMTEVNTLLEALN